MTFQVSEISYEVTFAQAPQSIQTLEGEIRCAAGDAVVTGSNGESWPVPRDAFFRKYVPLPGSIAREDGQYTKRLAFVRAHKLDQEESIQLSDGRGRLTGGIGDWCLTYGIGNQAFVRSDIFSESYQPSQSITVTIGVDSALLGDALADLADAETALRAALPHTPLFFVTSTVNDHNELPPWFQVVRAKPRTGEYSIDAQTVLLLEELTSRSVNGSLLSHIQQLQNRTVFSFTWDRFCGMLTSFFSDATEATNAELIAAQFVAVDKLNAALQQGGANEFFIRSMPAVLVSAASDDLRRVGAVADVLAVEAQTKWQHSVLTDTKSIANMYDKRWFIRPFAITWLLLSNSIVTLGMLAALGLAGFSELAEGCEAGDWFAWTGCTTEGWKHWVGFGAFALYIGALATAWLRYALAKVRRYEGKHQDYRLLAECLRVQYVLYAMGVTQCVADDFHAEKNAESSWVLFALRSLTRHAGSLNAATDVGKRSRNDLLNWVMTAFVDEQALYHEATLIKTRKHAIQVLSATGRLGAGLFLFCLIMLTANVISKLVNHEAALFNAMGQHILLILQVAGLALWGSMRKVMDTFALEQEIQRGLIVSDALKRANASDKQSIIQAAKLFARDQAAWHALRRSKPVEATTGGG